MDRISRILIFIVLLFPVLLSSQQTINYSLALNNSFLYNPSFVGQSEYFELNGFVRSQWVGFEGAPNTQVLDVELPLNIIGSGIGVSFINNSIGLHSILSAKFNYSFKIINKRNSSLNIGVSGGVSGFRFRGQDIITPEGDYTTEINHSDDDLFNILQKSKYFNSGVGLNYKYNNLVVGLSVENLFTKFFDSELSFIPTRHYFCLLEYEMRFSEHFVIEPHLNIATDFVETQAFIGAMVTYKGRYGLGLGMRGYSANSKDAIVFLGSYRLTNELVVTYSYDIGVAALKTSNLGSHEFGIKYRIYKIDRKNKYPGVEYSPRYL